MNPSMLDLNKEVLDQYDALTPGLNSHIQRIVNAIVFTTVNDRMKATIAVAQLTNFASQFRRNIMLWDDTSVPINAISFIVTGSGGGKDSSVKAARKCFADGFAMIESHRKQLVTDEAIKAAEAAGEDQATEFDTYKQYLKPIPPIDITPTTEKGLTVHLTDIGDLGISSGFIYSGEFSDELAYNPNMEANIKLLSEVYDTGDKEAIYTAGIEFRTRAIKGQPISALFVGSPGHILYDPTTRKKFDIAFMSKLARRSWFCYTPERIPEPVFSTLEKSDTYEDNLEIEAKQARIAMSEHIKSVASFGISSKGQDIAVSPEAKLLFRRYKRYNADLADIMPNQDSTSVLIRRHLQWKAIKLAGAFAIFDKSNTIEQHHYIDAIRFSELLSEDMKLFEHDLSKSDHERFADYLRTEVKADGKAIINVHDIKKQGFTTSTSKTKLQELVTLCAGYDTDGIYSVINEGGAIQYEPIIKTDVLGISFKPINTDELNNAITSGDSDRVRSAKHNISVTTAYGFEVAETTFLDLGQLLTKDFAYSPFKFRNGVRGKDNIIGGTKWLVYDVDESSLSASEAHFMLGDLNHHIALSSDPSNEYKFRVLIELDSPIELDNITWKHFTAIVAHDLALQVDPLPRSQIFFSYANRPVLSVIDASPLEVRNFVMAAKERTTMHQSDKPLSPAQSKAQLADELETFSYAFNAAPGTGSRNIYRMVQHAKLLGATIEQVHTLIDDVNDAWAIDMGAMPDDRINKLKDQAVRLY